MVARSDFAFDAFISYRRVDGGRLAKYSRLQTFQVPKEVVQHLPESIRQSGRRKLQIYLDVAHERAAEDFLNNKVIPVLEASKRLIVISTPAAFEDFPTGPETRVTNWLRREIDHFSKHGVNSLESTLVIVGRGALLDSLS